MQLQYVTADLSRVGLALNRDPLAVGIIFATVFTTDCLYCELAVCQFRAVHLGKEATK